ncbi:ABC transporter substrate-binding protein [Bosea sp. BIWAKO-01]|uniref:ABC transporter substrate-binding protein n=1 Tax=Bosea sp. BIWAKO-01 TaxID=506668 RepID=UPI00159EFC90|nr:ABC transporter substrate-binding protein [Bosea sp. BIWAKO-01]
MLSPLLLLSLALSVSLVLSSGSAHAQQAARKPARIGWISLFPLAQVESYLGAFRSGLAAEGYVEGRDVEVLARSADGKPDRLSAVVDELVGLKPDVIVAQGTAVFGLRRVTQIPVVYGFSGDPVVAELTDRLARPSGNLTGVSFMAIELNEKRLDLLRMAAPHARRVVLMGDPVHPGAALEIAASQAMASRLGMELRWVPTRNVQEVGDLLASLAKNPPDALVVLPDSVMLQSRRQVAAFASEHRIPAISGWSAFARSGGLLTFGPRLEESFKRLAYYTARILKGAKPSELPVERSSQFELVLNLKAARQIGLTMPDTLIALADEVIE